MVAAAFIVKRRASLLRGWPRKSIASYLLHVIFARSARCPSMPVPLQIAVQLKRVAAAAKNMKSALQPGGPPRKAGGGSAGGQQSASSGPIPTAADISSLFDTKKTGLDTSILGGLLCKAIELASCNQQGLPITLPLCHQFCCLSRACRDRLPQPWCRVEQCVTIASGVALH